MFDFLKGLMGGTDNAELVDAVKNGAFLVDVRTPQEFAAGHVKGSVNIPLDQVPQNLDKFKGKSKIVVFCRSGNRSGQAKAFLNQNGFTNVINGGSWEDVAAIVNKNA
ncbi:MAG: rhodanese-like domain-containing protein [Chloroherpetonaceae bacterium]|nr:rhodanese-like domain-containing protein [Chloroherpetonaceae bacterium]MDW8436591.1 rhodanese-like domain-containing protein [Chloroherpetonaceae bacterium]